MNNPMYPPFMLGDTEKEKERGGGNEREKDMTREVEKKVTGWESERDSKGDGVWKEKKQRKGKKQFPTKFLATIETPFLILKIG